LHLLVLRILQPLNGGSIAPKKKPLSTTVFKIPPFDELEKIIKEHAIIYIAANFRTTVIVQTAPTPDSRGSQSPLTRTGGNPRL
jgi:hypothetical protein